MSRKLRHVISDEEATQFFKKDIRLCKDVLSRSDIDLLRISDCGYSQIKSLIKKCSEAIAPKPSNALQMCQEAADRGRGSNDRANRNYMTTSLPALDKVLRGGLPVGTITEVTGPPGSGKTQFCLMLSTIVSARAEKGVIYIDTEGSFSAQRLMEMLQTRFPQMDSLLVENAMKRVHVIYAQTCSSLKASIDSIEELVISKDVQLILIDSIASLMRKEFSSASQSIIERTNLLTKLASTLKYTAEFFRIPVVASNQTTTQINHTSATFNQEEGDVCPGGDERSDMRGQGELIAALGNTWSHSVNTRLILQYLAGSSNARQMLVAKSPVSGFGAVTCRVQAQGILQCGEDATFYEGTNPGLQKIVCKGQFPSIPAAL